MKASRRSITAIVQRAIDGGRHHVKIDPEGNVTILPLGVSPVHADATAYDAEIREHLGHGDATH